MRAENWLIFWYLLIALLIFLAMSARRGLVAALFGWMATANIVGVIVYLLQSDQERRIEQPAHHLLIFLLVSGFGYVIGTACAKNRLRPP